MEQSNVREPLVDTSIDEKSNLMVITTEMPGISKGGIKVNASNNLIVLHCEKGDKKYHTEIPVKTELEDSSAKPLYTNGILELKIKLKGPVKSKGMDIKIE
ncbi:hypothetical protein [Candidatus Nitrosocosmicus arcticus]|uniref:Heat-shock protein Hsp20 n=1 Tax=Candidatus Nitrosocosmicus arcticus TaxID=2035267 RepID=A0A557SY67_9ARCH|nr:hypothetical protein [Candidatus Nitrosocosmicus arcticus]TVP41549.1 heat-shock protein Hsp20 [Candidatus Nitrosocosmicus arcticus]